MRIEEAIQQKRFKNEYEKLIVNIQYTYSHLKRNMMEILKPYELTQPQYNVMRILRGQHPKAASVNLLIERMVDPASNASRLVDKLFEKQLVSRKVSEEDRRRMDVKITKHGLKILAELDEKLDVWYEEMSSISQQEAQSLNGLLDKVRMV